MGTGAAVLPHIMRDTTDRNRTSPFAFTGNKFEFRMPGSSLSVANANIALNTAVAEMLGVIADSLESVAEKDRKTVLRDLLREMLAEHKRVLFDGNGYTEEWVEEARRRGLKNLPTLPDAMPAWISEKTISLFEKHGILTRQEILSRHEILLENYAKAIHIEALTLQEMARKDFMEGLLSYMDDLAGSVIAKRSVLGNEAGQAEKKILAALEADEVSISGALEQLSGDIRMAEGIADFVKLADYCKDTILKDMEVLRKVLDHAEALIPDKYLPYPTYGKILFSLR